MAFVSFPEPTDLSLPYDQTITDGKPLNFNKWSVENPHPGFGKDPNILNELGHTKFPMWVNGKIANNEEEEKALRNPSSVPVVAPNPWPNTK